MRYLLLILMLLALPAQAATYYCDAGVVGGLDDGSSEANAFNTLQKGLNAAAAGDTVWVQGGTNYVENASSATAGSTNSFIWVSGYTTTIGDEGMATIAPTSGVGLAITGAYWRISNLRVTGASDGFTSTVTVTYENCQADSCTDDGFDIFGNAYMENCSAFSNSSYGIEISYKTRVIGCKIYSNTNGGIWCSGEGLMLHGCLIYANGGYSIWCSRAIALINCTMDGDGAAGTTGIYTGDTRYGDILINNIVYDYADAYNNTGTGAVNIGTFSRNNLLYSNTTNGDWYLHSSDITASAPGFTDEANDDYTLGTGSAAIDAGYNWEAGSAMTWDIGALQTEPSGGGGSSKLIYGN